jgi:small-conductance mechanosensitive channel
VGWLLVQTKGLYAVGDRIRVGDVRGDVMHIGVLTTTLWEFGRATGVGDLPSGRRVSVPNKMLLEQPVTNYSADFPYMWDEVQVPVAMEGDWRLARDLLLKVAEDVVGSARMAAAVDEYEVVIAQAFTPYKLARAPTVRLRMDDSWLTLTLRYLVHLDEVGAVRSRITEGVLDAFAQHPDALPPVYPRIQPMPIDGRGRPLARAVAPDEAPYG